jgi:hypothetical protein
MKKDIAQKRIILLLLILLFATLCMLSIPLSVLFNSAAFWEVGKGDASASVENYSKSGTYKIDANTVLDSISHNQVFFPPDTTTLNDPITTDELKWKQAEYLKVASAFFEFVWRESLDENWSVNRMIFDTSCKENPADFESATFVFYQQIFQQRKLKYKARAIEILPLEGKISWGGDNTFYRPVFGANVIDLDELKISADEALNIAEENGGKAIRASFQNDCNLYLVLSGDYWLVVYDPRVSNVSRLEVNIDPYTGKVINSIMR